MNIDLYVSRDAWLHQRDPRVKLALSLCLFLTALLQSQPVPVLVLLLLTHLLALSTRLPLGCLLRAWRGLLPITIMILILASFMWGAPGVALAEIGPFRATEDTIANAVMLASRLAALAFSLMLLLWTTGQAELVAGLTRLGLPYGPSLTLAIALQFVPTFTRIYREILEAQQSRGLIIPRNPFKAAQAYLPVLVPLLITALRSADNLSMALESRGYRPGEPRSSRRVLRMGRVDWGALAGGLALVSAGIVLRLI